MVRLRSSRRQDVSLFRIELVTDHHRRSCLLILLLCESPPGRGLIPVLSTSPSGLPIFACVVGLRSRSKRGLSIDRSVDLSFKWLVEQARDVSTSVCKHNLGVPSAHSFARIYELVYHLHEPCSAQRGTSTAYELEISLW